MATFSFSLPLSWTKSTFLCVFLWIRHLPTFYFIFKKIDVTNKAIAEILSKATEYLQPNPGKVRKCLEMFCYSFTVPDPNNPYLVGSWLTWSRDNVPCVPIMKFSFFRVKSPVTQSSPWMPADDTQSRHSCELWWHYLGEISTRQPGTAKQRHFFMSCFRNPLDTV